MYKVKVVNSKVSIPTEGPIDDINGATVMMRLVTE